MRGSRYLDHSRRCLTCGNGRLCQRGREILSSPRGPVQVPTVPVSRAASTPIDMHRLIIGSAL